METVSVGIEPTDAGSMLALRCVPETRVLHLPVYALIGNSVPTATQGIERTKAWKGAVAEAVRRKRGAAPWPTGCVWAVTVGFSFHLRSHGNRKLDIENFLKPTIDALTAGLLGTSDEPLHYNHDDSGICHLLVHRLPDAVSAEEEGAWIVVSGGTP